MDSEIITWYSGKIVDVIAKLPNLFRADPYNRRQCVQLEEIDKILQRENTMTVYREEYVDRHFIHDFCGHYGSCFQDYPKKCIRLHFFTEKFTLDQFKLMLANSKYVCNWREYLGEYVGFIVLRPIPQAILGNVSLKAPSDNEHSYYLRKTIVSHLCGLDLEVQTIPFQEQDNAISACATASLWIALHAISSKNPYSVPSPHKLTGNARKVTEEDIKSHRVTKGLTISQMARAVKEEELEPLVCVPHSTSYAKALIRAYSSAKIPVVLGIELYFRSDYQSKFIIDRIIGNHAVTVLGWKDGCEVREFDSPDLADYRGRVDTLPDYSEGEREVNRLFLESSAINELYCHDDQIGPYSLISFKDEYSSALTTEWTRIYNGIPVDAMIVSVLVPCSPKVRIRFSNVYEIVKVLNVMFYSHYHLLGYQLTWDIRLESVCHFRQNILADKYGFLDADTKFEVLSIPFPRFVWVIDQYLQQNEEDEIGGEIMKTTIKEKVASFIFDSTDIQNSDFLINIVHFNKNVYPANQAILQKIFSEYDSNLDALTSIPSIVRALVKHYKTPNDCKIIVNKI